MTNIEEPLNTQENIDIEVQENTETKGKIDNSDVSMLLDQIKVLKQEIQNNKPQPKVKKQATEKQLEQLKRAREIKAKNTQLRKEVAKNKKIEEKKIINETVEKLKTDHNNKDEIETSTPDLPPVSKPEPIHKADTKPAVADTINKEDDIPDITPTGYTGGYDIYTGDTNTPSLKAVPSSRTRRRR